VIWGRSFYLIVGLLMRRYIAISLVLLAVCPFLASAECHYEIALMITPANGSPCGTAPTALDVALPNPSCTGRISDHNCHSYVREICCPLEVLNKYRDDKYGYMTLSGVTLGEESIAAQAAFDIYKTGTTLNPPSADFQLTGEFEGFIYSSDTPASSGFVDVNVTMWKRGYYTRAGTASGTTVPIENLGSSGGASGGLTQAQAKAAFLEALQTDGLTGIQNAVDAAIAGKLGADSIKQAFLEALQESGISGGGLDQAEAEQAFEQALEHALAGVYSGGDASGKEPYQLGSKQRAFADVFGNFKTAMQSTSLFNMQSNFFGGLSGASSSSVIAFGTSTYGSHTVDFSAEPWSSVFAVLRGIIMVVLSYVSLKILILKGGGG